MTNRSPSELEADQQAPAPDLEAQLAAAEEKIRHLEARLSRQTDQFRAVFDISHTIQLLTDPRSGRIHDANEAACHFYGYPKETLIEMTLAEINVLPQEEVDAAFARARADGQGFTPLRHRLANGDVRDVEVYAGPIQIDGETWIYSIVHDVTRRISDKLDQQLLWQAIEQSANSVVITDLKGDIRYVNPYFTRLTGYTLDEVLGKNPRILQSGQTSPAEYQEMWDTLASGREWSGEFQNIKKSGELYWESAIISPVLNASGEATHYIGIKEDITESKRNADQIIFQRDRAQTYLDIAGTLIIALDRDGNLTTVNNKACEVLGGTRETLIGLNWFENFLPAESQEQAAGLFKQIFNGGVEPVEFYENPIRALTGKTRIIAWHNTLLTDDSGQVTGLLSSGEDVTEVRQLIDRLELETDTQSAILRLLHSGSPDQETFIETVLEEALILTHSTIGYFHFVHPDQENLSLYKWSKGVMEYCYAEEASHYPLSEAGIWADCVRERKPVIHNDYPNNPERKGLPEGHFPLIRHMSVPIMDRNKVVAILGVGNKVDFYTDADSSRLELMSNTLWNWIERKRAEEQITKQNRELSTINRITEMTSSTLDMISLLHVASRELQETFKAHTIAAAVINQERTAFDIVLKNNRPQYEPILKDRLMRRRDPLFQTINRSVSPFIIEHTNRQEYAPYFKCLLPDTAMFIPLRLTSGIGAILCLIREDMNPYTAEETRIATHIGQAIAQAFENSLLHQQVMEHNSQLEEIVEERSGLLKRRNDQLNAILDNTHDAIVLVDRDSKIERSNLAFDEMFVFQYGDLVDRPVVELAKEAHRARFREALKAARETGIPQRIELELRNREGEFFESDTAINLIHGNSGHTVCSIRDITHIKEVERVKDRFVSMVSHELKTPISGILLSSDLMRNYYDRMGDDQKQRKVDQIRNQALTLTEMVKSILDIYRFDSRKEDAGYEWIDTNLPLTQVLEELAGAAQAKQHTLETYFPAEPIELFGSEVDLQVIWRNLLSNAIKYTDDAGVVRIGLYHSRTPQPFDSHLPDLTTFSVKPPIDLSSRDYLVGIVEDNGHGIGPDDLPQLFTRFYRGWAKGTSIAGTGLGLSFVREILNMYGGDISVTSELGVGTAFQFWIPIQTGDH